VLVAGALAPAAAQAGEAHVEGPAGNRTIVFTAAPGESNDVLIDREDFTDDKYQLEDQDNDVSAGDGCENKPHFPSGTEPNIVSCDPTGVKRIRIVLGNGQDSARFGNLDGNVITDIVDGGPGNDRVTGSNGPSIVTGGPENDEIDARGGADRVSGGDGEDIVVGGPGADNLAGDAGNDKIKAYAQPGTLDIGIITKYQGGVPNTLSGGPGNDTLEGDNGPDAIGGDAGNDKLHGGGAADKLRGGDGKDTIDEGDTAGNADGEAVGAPIAADVVDGGGGKDTATYCTRRGTAPLKITLDGKPNDGRAGEEDLIKSSVENVLGGGQSGDIIKGNGKGNVLTGDCFNEFGSSGGDNRIFGLGGNDKVVGGDGEDTLNGGSGKDAFIGNAGADAIKAKDGTRDKSINCDGFTGESSNDKAKVDKNNDPFPAMCEHVSY
jgi:Ca2+-binding RTX toxin-like protein